MKQMKLSMAWSETLSPAKFISVIFKGRPIMCRGSILPWLLNLLLTWQLGWHQLPLPHLLYNILQSPVRCSRRARMADESVRWDEGKRSPSCFISEFGSGFKDEGGISELESGSPHFVASNITCFLVHLLQLPTDLWINSVRASDCPGSIKPLLLADQGTRVFRASKKTSPSENQYVAH